MGKSRLARCIPRRRGRPDPRAYRAGSADTPHGAGTQFLRQALDARTTPRRLGRDHRGVGNGDGKQRHPHRTHSLPPGHQGPPRSDFKPL